MSDQATCPVCGQQHEGEPIRNVTAIQGDGCWVRIEMADEDIRKLVSGMWRIALVPVEKEGE